MERFCKIAPGVPKMANMLEGGEHAHMHAEGAGGDGVQDRRVPAVAAGDDGARHGARCAEIRDDGYPDESSMPTFEELKRIVGFPEYYVDEARYDTTHKAHVPNIPPPPVRTSRRLL